ncbi:MAG: thiamine phosphate synthase, partial [Bdellovibrionales bacterium]|nr:thiamine phosphate synthase [Bdellovibrionales bacterium]
ERLHIRKPTFSKSELIDYLARMNPEHRARCVIHQHHELVESFALAAAHLNELSRRAVNEVPEGACTTSVHTQEDARSLVGYEYAFMSPIFPSISKAHYVPKYTEDALREIVAKASVPLCALGGICKEKLPTVSEMGFSHVALCGAIWNAKDPIREWTMTQESWQ